MNVHVPVWQAMSSRWPCVIQYMQFFLEFWDEQGVSRLFILCTQVFNARIYQHRFGYIVSTVENIKRINETATC